MITVASRLGCRICIGRLAMQPSSSGPYVYHVLGSPALYCAWFCQCCLVSSELYCPANPSSASGSDGLHAITHLLICLGSPQNCQCLPPCGLADAPLASLSRRYRSVSFVILLSRVYCNTQGKQLRMGMCTSCCADCARMQKVLQLTSLR